MTKPVETEIDASLMAIVTAVKKVTEAVIGSGDPVEDKAAALRQLSETLINVQNIVNAEEDL